MEIWTDKIISTAIKKESVFTEATCEAPCELTPPPACSAEPICCEGATASMYYDEPASCESFLRRNAWACMLHMKSLSAAKRLPCSSTTTSLLAVKRFHAERPSVEKLLKQPWEMKHFLVKGGSFLLEKLAEDIYVRTKRGGKKRRNIRVKTARGKGFQDAAESVL